MLEATLLLLDNSEPARNGDYLPSRYDAQTDAVHLLFQAKTSSNPESAVGLMTTAGPAPRVLTTLTTDEGKLVRALAHTRVGGTARVATALSIAALALKHRQNKSQQPRIVVFGCSRVTESKGEMERLGRKLKKGGVAVDVILLGEGALEPEPAEGEGTERKAEEGNTEEEEDTTRAKWTAFHAAIRAPADSDHASHLAIIPPSENLLSDAILASEILTGDGGGAAGVSGTRGTSGGQGEGAAAAAAAAGAAAAEGGNAFEDLAGLDQSDPELALALRMSMEEEERRRAQREREESERLERVDEEQGEGKKEGEGEGMDES